MTETIICEMEGVRGGDTGFCVQLVQHEDGRFKIRAINEGGFNCTDVDLSDLLEWLSRIAPDGVDIDRVIGAISVFNKRHG